MQNRPKLNVPFFNYPSIYKNEREDLLKLIDDIGCRGAFIMQNDLIEFERNLAKYCGSNYAVGVGNATDGLELSLMAMNLKRGDEVICSAHTMLATASAIITAGGVPVPVDIDNDNLIDPSAIESAITSNTVGLLPTQLNGRICKMDRIQKIAEKNKLFIVEDAAQALGAKYKGKHSGTFGAAGAISFFPAKVLGCLGDGGAIIANDKEIFQKIYQLHDHGRNQDGEVMCWGRNSRLDNLQAAILDSRLKTYQKTIDRRREIARIYNNNLAKIEQLSLPPGPDGDDEHYDIYQNYELQAEDRDKLKEYLQINGIGTLIQWGGKAVHQWENLNFNLSLPRVENFFKHCIMLPLNMSITNDEVHYVCEKINDFYKK